LAFGGGGSSTPETLAHTHNAALSGDGGDLSETLTDMNGVALYSLITDNSAAVAANTVDIAANTAAIAAIGSVPSGLIALWEGSLASIPAGWVFYSDIASGFSQLTSNTGKTMNATRVACGQQFSTGNELIGRSPISVTWYLYGGGAPTGTISAYITDSTGVVRETSTTTVAANTLPIGIGNQIPVEFTFAGTTALTNGDMITVADGGASTATDTVSVAYDSTTGIANSAFSQENPAGSWSFNSGNQAKFILDWGFQYIQKS